jgi:hypothetical protein
MLLIYLANTDASPALLQISVGVSFGLAIPCMLGVFMRADEPVEKPE